MIQEVATLSFLDNEACSEALATVRVAGDNVMLGVSLLEDGDVEVSLRPDICEALIQALSQALDIVRENASEL